MEQPKRVQLSRRKGWKMPPNTVSVARPTAFGNPYRIGGFDNITGERIANAEHAVQLFGERVAQPMHDAIVDCLRGKNLACWCKLGEPCHADVLLKVANA